MVSVTLLHKFLYTAKVDANEIAPIDILSVNTFFIIMWLLGQMSIWNFYS